MQGKSYSYPIDESWNTQELETVIAMFRQVEDAYEVGVNRQKVLQAYRQFKKVIPAKSEEKRLGREFEKTSGYVLYRVVKKAQDSNAKRFKME
ncbi:UPF0223 family protein [Limosilactobacillus sp.]|uniref:UPF0223 family protein n=1 Tax=Limosilactobacillus sp. TaxID=2773925 RepID=UPI00345E1F5A